MDVLQKFLRYVQVDTPSNGDNDTVVPSNMQEFDLAHMLVEELHQMGIANAEVDEHCYVYASIPANVEGKKAIGFIAHMDVVNETKGYGVKPQITHYTGGDIPLLNGDKIAFEEFPVLADYVGMDIVTSDGTTILGADDKAGVAEIMTLAQYLMEHPEVPHGKIGIAFTPDEEIGNGASMFDVKRFGCDFAYTVDGEQIGEVCYETFNGAGFEVDIQGLNIHPGSAKGKMINAIIVAQELIAKFPSSERPETTEGREGYYFFHGISGNVEKCKLTGIVRDHDKELFLSRKAFVEQAVAELNVKYGDRLKLNLHDQYYNCVEVIKPHYHLVQNVIDAMESLGVKPICDPIRGGTDGSGLSFKGLPCPNICTGGHNAHGVHEFVPVQCMQKVVEILKLVVHAYGV